MTKYKTAKDLDPKYEITTAICRKLAKLGNFPARYMNSSPRELVDFDWTVQLVKHFYEFSDKGKMLVLPDSEECVKFATVLAINVEKFWGNYLDDLYVTYARPIDILNCHFDKDNVHGDVDTIQRMFNSKFVALHGLETVHTVPQRDILNYYISHRLNNNLFTIFITSMNDKTLKEFIGNSSFEMLQKSKDIKCDTEN